MLFIPLWCYAQPILPACVINPLSFGIVVPGQSKSIHYSDVTNALCVRQVIENITRPIVAYITLPTHLTNGIDVIPIAFESNNAFVMHKVHQITILRTVFNPNVTYSYPLARDYIQFNIGGTIQVPPIISPGSYTATVTINVIH